MIKPHTITAAVLVENTVSVSELKAEHGLSVFIKTEYGNILWDTGQSPLFIENASKMGIDLQSIDHVALSHGHYDHTGGLDSLITLNPRVHVHGHPDMFKQRYSRSRTNWTSVIQVGSPIVQESVEKSCQSLKLERQMSEVLPGVFLTGEIPRVSYIEDTGGDFFLDLACIHKDTIPDDQALFIDTYQGIIVFLGCAHSGVINTLNHIAQITGKREMYALFGGMHLLRASDKRLEETADILNHYNVQLIGPCHCTGSRAQAYFHSRFPDRIKACETGSHMF